MRPAYRSEWVANSPNRASPPNMEGGGSTVAEGDGEVEGLVVYVSEGVSEGVRVGDGVTEGVSLSLADGDVVAESDGESDGVAV